MMIFQRETSEFLPVMVSRNGVQVTSGVETAITSRGVRPSAWTAAMELGGQVGLMVEDLTPGVYDVWVRISADPEEPVKWVGAVAVH